MAEVDKIYDGKLVHGGNFDFKGVYSFLHEWLSEEEGFAVVEKKYSEKVKGDSKDVEVEWECYKKVNDYFRLKVKSKIRVLGMSSVEVQENGVKKKMNKGEFEFKMDGFLEKDYENKWEENAFMKFMRGVYDKFVIKNRIEQYEDKIVGVIDGTIAQLKSFFALEGKR